MNKYYPNYPIGKEHDHGNATGSNCIVGVPDCDYYNREWEKHKYEST